MEIFLSAIHILLMFMLVIMLVSIVLQPRSRAQIAFILYDVFVLIFVFGLEMELLHSDTVDAALSGLAMQYLGQCGFTIALLWFANEFIQMKLPGAVFIAQMVLSAVTMAGILTAGMNTLFYTSTRIIYEGFYPRIDCDNGILWYVHYIYFFVVFFYIIIFCLVKYHTLSPIHRRRIVYLLTGLGILLAELILKGLGVFGSYNPVGIALTGTVVCLMMAVLKEGYFGSIDATMENIMNHGDEGLIVLDAWTRIVFVNDQAYHLFPGIRIGYPLSSQKKLAAVVNGENGNVVINGSIWETRMEDISENGTRTGTMIYFINVTDLVRQSEQLKAASDERVRFMTRASHELRSPLNVVLGADEMILRGTQEPSVREYAVMIREEAGSMVNLVEDIINSALAEQNMLSIKEEDFSLRKALQHLNAVYVRKAENKGFRFSVLWDGMSADAHPDIMLRGDRNRLLQVLINLLDNAVKYTGKGSFGLEVVSGKRTDESYPIKFTVWDTGTGIPESEQKDVFEKYRRGHEAENSGKEGLGLGLSIVKSFVEAMGGSVGLESKPGAGSRFIVELPFKKAETTAEGNWGESPEGAEAAGTVSFAGRRILVVDDRPRNILVMRHMLKETELTIDEAGSGPAAVEMCRNRYYDVIILDYMMPGMDGGQTLKAIREDPDGKNADTYSIVFSANVTPDAEKMYKEQGFSDFLSKPVSYDRLVQTIGKALRSHETASSGDPAEGAVAAEAGSEEDGGDAPMLQRLRGIGVDTDAGIAFSDEDPEFYAELLHSFAEGTAGDREDLMTVWEAAGKGDVPLENGLDAWKEFTRIAHGIKGELRGFGDSGGAELFYTLEKDGKAGDQKDIETVLPQALARLDQFVTAVTGV